MYFNLSYFKLTNYYSFSLHSDIKTLQHSINNSPFPDSSVVLTVEPYRSTRYSTADVTDHPSGGGRHSSSSFSDTVVIEELPFGVKNWQLRIYLNSLGVKCVDIQMKEGNMAVIQMDKKTGEYCTCTVLDVKYMK